MSQEDEKKFSELYQKYASYMYGVCLRYTGNKEDAEDMMQDGFVKVYNNIDKLKDIINVKAWIKRIMINTALNLYRHNKIIDFKSIDEGTYDIYKSYEQDAIQKLTTNELLNVIQELPEGYRLVFNLYAIEGYKHREIAELLNINEGTSKSQFSKARSNLKKLIDKKLNISDVNNEK